MGLSCSIGGSESGLHSHLDDGRQHLLQTPTEDYTAMTEGSSEFDKFKDCCTYIWQFGEKINGQCDELSRHYREMKKRNEELKAEIENLRKRYVKFCMIFSKLYTFKFGNSTGRERWGQLFLFSSHCHSFDCYSTRGISITMTSFNKLFFEINRISNDSEMNQRSDQSSCEDTSSKNRRSNVLHQYRVVNGATRKGAMEVLGKTSNRAQIWYRKDLTCRIFLVLFLLIVFQLVYYGNI